MREKEKIAELFEFLQQGDCWVGVNMQQALKGIDAGMAAAVLYRGGNTIWQLVNHLVYWRKTVLIRLQGKNALPPMPDMYLPSDLSEDSWQTTIRHFEEVYQQLHTAITNFREEQLDKDSPKKGQTYYHLLTGCLQHDAYHLGQIVLLKKMVAAA
jgi:uncharacterized damage-inducible protein DinB